MKKIVSLVVAVVVGVLLSWGTTYCEIGGLVYGLEANGQAYILTEYWKRTYMPGSHESGSYVWVEASKVYEEINAPETISEEGKEYLVTKFINTSPGLVCNLESAIFPNTVCEMGTLATSKIQQINLPTALESIVEKGFWQCQQLQELIIPDKVKSIGEYAFAECTVLSHIHIGKSVDSIAYTAFWDTPALQSITVDESNEYYMSDDGVLLNKEQTELLCFPVTKTGSYQVPSSVKRISPQAFKGSQLSELILPAGLKEIGQSAFKGCTQLTKLVLPPALEVVGDSAFEGVPAKMKLDLSSVTTLGARAFAGCEGLESVELPESLSQIGKEAFQGCTGLRTLTIPSGVKTITESFVGCTNLSTLVIKDSDTPLTISGSCFDGANSSITHLYIGRSLVCTQEQFKGNENLQELTIGSLISEIPDNMFYGCDNLYQVKVYCLTPPESYLTTFSSNTLDGTLYVPASVEDSYRRKTPWRFFYMIEVFPDVAPTRIELSCDEIKLDTKDMPEQHLSVTIYPDNATYTSLTWHSNNEPVATVENGIISAVSAGEADITVKVDDGTITATCHILVIEQVDGIEVTPVKKIIVYPNPVDDVLHIQGAKEGETIRLIGLSGHTLRTVQATEEESVIDTSDLPSGIYFCRVAGQTVKVMKQ